MNELYVSQEADEKLNRTQSAGLGNAPSLPAHVILASATSMPREARTSIWFFIGLILTVYGVLILGASLHDLVVPPEHTVVLANLHAGIWWGVLLIVLGLIYTLVFAPWRKKAAR
jgi:hypothetical protein